MRVIIIILCCFIAFLNNANAGGMYNCIDRDGNKIITDNPQDGMKNCVLEESFKTSPQGLDQECIQELEASVRDCKKVFMDKSHIKKLSPNCRKQIESNQYPEPDTPCGKEMQTAGQAMMSAIMECRDKRISARCKESINSKSKKLQEESIRCSDVMKRISSVCGSLANEKCYKKHDPEFKAACGSKLNSEPAVPPDREMP